MRYNHGKHNYDLVSHNKSTTPASQTKLGSSSFSCELCGYKGDMAGQLKKHVESMHIYLLHAIRSAENKSLFSGWMEKEPNGCLVYVWKVEPNGCLLDRWKGEPNGCLVDG